MTSTPDGPIPDDDETPASGAGPSEPPGAPGAELGLSDGSGGTFEPEEDTEPDA
jgi:hypothetical protein